jgi:hypothetical protein
LFLRVIDHYIEAVIEPRLSRYLGVSRDPIADLYRFFRTAQTARGCLLTTTAIELGPTSSAIRERLERGLAVLREALQIQAQRVLDHESTTVTSADLAQALLIDLQGLMVLSRLGIGQQALRRHTQMVFCARFGERFQSRTA